MKDPNPNDARRPGGQKLATAYDVARLAGVSQSAVSRTFTDGASVSPATREKVMEAAAALRYRPSHMARSLKTGRSLIVGVAVTSVDNLFYPQVLEALADALRGVGYRMLLFVTHGDTNFDPALDELLRYRVDALILASTSLSSPLAEECRQSGVPVVMFNNIDPDSAMASVTGDNRKGGETIAAFMHAAGHRRFGFIAGVESSSTSQQRELGFTGYLTAQGLQPPMRAVSQFQPGLAMQATRDLLKRPDAPDALFCVNDHMALAAMDVARHEFGLEVGKDISIIGFDNIGLSAWPSFGLTTYSQPVDRLVAETMALLTEAMADANALPRKIMVGGELIVRTSARLPNQK